LLVFLVVVADGLAGHQSADPDLHNWLLILHRLSYGFRDLPESSGMYQLSVTIIFPLP
jgi:hypothetical protein